MHSSSGSSLRKNGSFSSLTNLTVKDLYRERYVHHTTLLTVFTTCHTSVASHITLLTVFTTCCTSVASHITLLTVFTTCHASVASHTTLLTVFTTCCTNIRTSAVVLQREIQHMHILHTIYPEILVTFLIWGLAVRIKIANFLSPNSYKPTYYALSLLCSCQIFIFTSILLQSNVAQIAKFTDRQYFRISGTTYACMYVRIMCAYVCTYVYMYVLYTYVCILCLFTSMYG